MKFYRENNKTIDYYYNKIRSLKLTCVYCTYFDDYCVIFFKNGNYHNYKNATYISTYSIKWFYLNGNYYGNQNDFNKKSWRKIVKLQAFL